MKVVNFFKNSFVLIGELAIFIVALSWLHNCSYNNEDCHEPLIAVIGSSLPLLVSLFLRIVDWFKKSEIQIYCEKLYQQYSDIRLPLINHVFQSDKTKYSLPKNIGISDIYIDLPLEIVAGAPTLSTKRKKFRFFDSNFFKKLQGIKHFGYRKSKKEKLEFANRTFTRYANLTFAPYANLIEPKENLSTTSISSVLEKGKKVIIIGDRGCGKSTLLGYLAYMYAYQIADPKRFNRNNTVNLPKINWIPVIIRCGNLNLNSTTNFSLILQQHLSIVQVHIGQINSLHEDIFSELTKGNVLLLIDSIDEIRDIDVRTQFCICLREFVQAYPKITVIISCIDSIFLGVKGVKQCFDERFEIVKISKLTFGHKKRFIQQWVQKVERKAESIEDLQNALITSRNLEGLTNNIQILSLVIQLPNINSLLQVSFADILREVIIQLIEKSQNQLGETLYTKEVMINLSEVALFMSNHKSNTIEESDIIRVAKENNQQAISNSTYAPHSPHLLLRVFTKYMGILESAYTEIDSTGVDRTYYRFIHPTYQDFFRVQAMMRQPNMTEVLSQLGMPDEFGSINKVSDDGNLISDGKVSNMSKLVISELPTERAEEVLLTLLYPQIKLSSEKSRARVIFSANLLSATPSVSKDRALLVINALLESVDPNIDGKGNSDKTPLDEAVYNLLHSPWSDVFETALLDAFNNYVGDKRIAIGSIISTQIVDLDNIKNLSIQDFCARIDTQPNKSETEQVSERLKLMSFAFSQFQGVYNGYFDNPDTKRLYDQLLDFSNASEAIQMSSVWALGWILNARDNQFMPKIKLNKAHISTLTEYLSHSENDSYGLYWAALCLSRYELVEIQPDWTYEWATVADCHHPQSGLSRPIIYKIKNIDEIANLLKYILSSSYHSLAKEGAVLTLGRLGHYPVNAGSWLLRIFENQQYSETARKEALNYLAQIKDRSVAQQIHSIYKAAFAGKNEFKSNYTYLALLAIGNVDILKEIIFQGITDLYKVGSMHSAFFALKTNKNQNAARELLKELNKSVNPEIRELSKIALMDFTGQSKTQVVQTVLTQLTESELGEGVSGGIADKTVCILLVRGENPDGGAIFAYVAVRLDKLQEFMEAQKNGVFYPEDYGVIIESGEGEPTEEIRKKMEDEYGFNHEVMVDL